VSDHDGQSNGSIDLRKLSQLIANGEHPFPTEIDHESQLRLANLVRQHRCNSLMDLIAKQIASDIYQQHYRLD